MKIKKNTKTIIITLGIILVSLLINGNKADLNITNEGSSIENQYERDHLKSANWEPEIRKSVGDEPFSVFIGDANNDGYNDIITANYVDDNVSICLWNPISIDWDPQITKCVGDYPRRVFIGDANNDGYNDIVTSNFYGHNVSILLWNQLSRDWEPEIRKFVGYYPVDVFIGDANNDGYSDIVTADYYGHNVSILLWNPISRDWEQLITKSVGDNPIGVFIGDANNDGYNDIVTANWGNDDVSIYLWNQLSRDWDAEITKSVRDGPRSVFIGDGNNDGYNDILTANAANDTVSICLWNPISINWDPQITKYVGDYPLSGFIGDANNDGYNDIITVNYVDDNVSIYLWNQLSRDWDAEITKSVGDGPYSVYIGDANNDGYNDIVTANFENDTISILLWSYVPPSIGIHTPEAKTYKGPMSGYYPATYGFEKSEIGIVPKGWINASDPPDPGDPACSVAVIEELGNHKNVVELYDPNEYNNSHLFNSFSLKSYGTVEFYMRANSVGWYSEVYLSKGNSHLFRVLFGSHYLRTYSNKTAINLLNVSAHQWYHIRIDFRCRNAPEYMGLNEKRFKIHIDDKEVGPFIIYDDRRHKGVNRMNFITGGSQHDYSLYVDDIGYSWDPNYNIGDNMNEGLLLSFDKNYPFNWIGYSLDGSASKAIQGNVTIPFPEDDSHTIQVFGKDSRGNIYQSGLRHFSVDTTSPMIIINTPIPSEIFGVIPPNFRISNIEVNKDTTWYTLDNGQTNFTFSGLTGTINQTEWDKKGNGTVNIRFYTSDTAGNLGYDEVNVRKDIIAPNSSISYVIHKEPNVVNKSTTFTLIADDGGGSGVSVIRYKINDSDWYDYGSPFDLSQYAYGDILLSYQAIDEVGNIEGINTVLVTLIEKGGGEFPLIIIIAIVSSLGGIGATLITVGILRKRKPSAEII
ncbi:MAG: FG-GAP repeat domain-containing protein [Promethearchaeota archaeon]